MRGEAVIYEYWRKYQKSANASWADARRVGISQWERNTRNPKHSTIQRIADALNVDPEELYNGDDSNEIHIACEKNQDVNIGENIRIVRIRRGLSQEELANKVNAATITIRQYESGKRQPRYEALQNIANALNVKTSELIGEGSDAEARMTVWFDVGKDDELIKHLESVKDINRYIKALIKADIIVQKER